MSGLFTKLEKINDLEVSIIRETKIHKVLRMIIKLPNIPRDEEFNFRKRALDILSKWSSVMDDRSTPAGDKKKEKSDNPKANGVRSAKSEKEDDTKLDSPDQDTPMPDVEEKTEETLAPVKGEAGKETSEPVAETAEDKEKPADDEKAEEPEKEKETTEVAA
jgi:hypothetical protein